MALWASINLTHNVKIIFGETSVKIDCPVDRAKLQGYINEN